jgi:glycine cleavage system H protein
MDIPADLKYTEHDEWVRVEGQTATAGITDYAQDQLSDVVYVELPAVGQALKRNERFGTVESVKAASDLSLPAAAPSRPSTIV